MSAFGGKADMPFCTANPKADIMALMLVLPYQEE